jgi:hypothetical protein
MCDMNVAYFISDILFRTGIYTTQLCRTGVSPPPPPTLLEHVYISLKAVLRIRIRIHRIHVFLGLLDLFWDFFLLFPLKNDVKVSSKSKMQKNAFKKLVFCWHLEGQ